MLLWLLAVSRTVSAGRCYGLGMPVEDVPFTFGRSPAQCRVVGLIDMLEVRRQCQPMLPQHVPIEVLSKCSFDNSRFHLVNAVAFAGKDFSGLDIGVHDELLLGLAMGVPEAIKALIGHAHKLGMLLLFLLVVGQFLSVVGLVGLPIHGRQRSGINRPVTLGLRGYLKE